jgi:tetratricopeptide (TPR) repeat protein
MLRRRFVIVIVALCAPALTAATPSTLERAKQHAAKAKVHYDLGEYEQAAQEYIRVYRIKPLPALLYNIAQSYRQAGKIAAARRFYYSYLRETKDRKDRAAAEAALAELDEIVARARRPASRPITDPAQLVGEPVAAESAERASTPAQPPATPAVTTRIDPKTASDAPANRVPAAALGRAYVASPSEGPRFYQRWWFWTAAGVAVVGAGAAIALMSHGGDLPSTHLGTAHVF